MIISGTITQAGQASAPSGQFNVRYQDIEITDQQGNKKVGRIGSKQGYATGVQIQVTTEQKTDTQTQQPYVYFKKYNPQYAQQQYQQPAPQQGQQPPSQAGQPANAPKGSKDRLIVAQVVYKALCDKYKASTPEFDLWITQNIAVYKRHIDMIMKAGADTLSTVLTKDEQSRQDAAEFARDHNLDEEPQPTDNDISPWEG